MSSDGVVTDGCEQTSATSRPSTMPSPPSTRPSGSRGRRSSGFVREDGGGGSRSALLVDHRRPRPSLRYLILLNRGRGFSDHIQHEVRLGQHWYVAAIGLEGCCTHALRDETLQLGLDGTVLRSDDVPTRLGSPRST